MDLYTAKMGVATRSSGLYLLQKLKLDHVQLNSYSRMKVSLAAQVCMFMYVRTKWCSTLMCFVSHLSFVGRELTSI